VNELRYELNGEIDLATVPELARALERIVDEPSGDVVLDGAGLAFIDSSGIRELVNARRELSAAGRRMRILNLHGPAATTLRVTGLSGYLGVEDAAPSARAS
jgi:anti-sigma B factor antagonist